MSGVTTADSAARADWIGCEPNARTSAVPRMRKGDIATPLRLILRKRNLMFACLLRLTRPCTHKLGWRAACSMSAFPKATIQQTVTRRVAAHKPVRRGREMIDLLAVEEPKPKPAKIRAVSYEAAIDQLFKRIRSSSSALTQQAVSNPRRPVPNERRRRRPPHGRRTGTTGEWPPAARR